MALDDCVELDEELDGGTQLSILPILSYPAVNQILLSGPFVRSLAPTLGGSS